MTPSPPPDANGNGTNNVRGIVNLVAQTFAGIKTFAATIIASAGIQLASLWNTNGTGSTDVCVQLGTSNSYGGTNANAKVLQAGTGIGGTFVESFYVTKDGVFVGGGAVLRLNNATGAQISYTTSYVNCAGGVTLNPTNGIVAVNGTSVHTANVQLNTAGNARPTANAANRGTIWYSLSAGGGADTVQVCLKSAADTYSWVTIATG